MRKKIQNSKFKFQFSFNKLAIYVVALFFAFLMIVVIFQQFRTSLIVKSKDRVNNIFYGKNAVYY